MIPEYLLTQIREGKSVLFLGAGASFDATDNHGNAPPNAKELGKLLSKRFLGGKHEKAPLNQIGEFAISESDLFTVQNFIREIFEPFRPAKQHLLLPSFRWFGIGTTNYDLVVEEAYKDNKTAVQNLAPLLDNRDRISERLRDTNSVPYIKLHGCITRVNDPDCPLILSTDQYIQHLKNRDRLFSLLKDWGIEHSLLFIGHSLQDPDIRAIIGELNSLGETRPRYYFVAPGVDNIQARFWESKHKITPISATFGEFFNELDKQLSGPFRGLTTGHSIKTDEFPIAERFVVKDWALSNACKQFLKTDATYVKGISRTELLSPNEFYKGMNRGWSGIEQNLDVRRRICDHILTEHFLSSTQNNNRNTELIVLKSHAGGGKSIALRRIAWQASKELGCICLWIEPHGVISGAAIQELITLCKERVYVFVDNAADRVREITSVMQQIGNSGRLLTIITAERINEWNSSCASLSNFVTNQYELRYLSESEIDELLRLLDQHNALGTLSSATYEERKEAFVARAGRQLLVALYEATMGKTFEDIILDEFNGITPYEAQQLYLTICILNRLDVPVRANLITHVHGLPYEKYRERLFAPLERIVQANFDPIMRDYLYQSRHPHIAEIVFERVFTKAEDRYAAYLRILPHMNDAYDVDRKAIRRLIRARSLLDVLSSHELIEKIYSIAKDKVSDDSYIFHQMALYEMHRPNGNLRRAGELLSTASKLNPTDVSVLHSLSEFNLKLSEVTKIQIEKERCLKEATKICNNLKNRVNDSHAYHTILKIGLHEFRQLLDSKDATDLELEDMLKKFERNLDEGLQRFPGDAHLLSAEAELAGLLHACSRARVSLEKAFSANPRSGYIGSQLARLYRESGRNDDALRVLRQAISANRSDRSLHFKLAQLLAEVNPINHSEIIYHFERAFAPGDNNIQARMMLGRQQYLANDFAKSKETFEQLTTIRAPAELRNKISFPLASITRGRVRKLEFTYGFIEREVTNDWVFVHRDKIDDQVWRQLSLNLRVTFRIGFTFKGPIAFDVELVK